MVGSEIPAEEEEVSQTRVLSWNVGGTLRQKRLLRALFPAETPRRERLEDVTHAIGFWPGVDRGCVCK
jgi:hypothetical protein